MAKFLTLDGLSYFLSKIKGIFVGAASDTTKGHVVTFGDDGKTITDSGFTIGKSVPANADFTAHTAFTTTANGVVPAPTAANTGKFLKGDGTWAVPANTTYSAATASKDGLMTSADFSKLSGIEADADVNVIESVKVNNTALSVTGKSVNIDLSGYAKTASIEGTYAKKTDISGVYKYKGTKESYSALPTTGNVTGDVWNITAADETHDIKAGDNVAWDGTKWDNLSGVFVVPGITNSDIDGLFTA